MTYRLRDNLHWCLCGGRVIFLDIEEDRYFCLPRATQIAFRRLAEAKAGPEDLEGLGPLIARGLLIADPASPGLGGAPGVLPATGDFLDGSFLAPGLKDLVGALAAEARAARLLRTRPLIELLGKAGGAAESGGLDDRGERLCRIVTASRAVSFILRASDRCLVRALAVQARCRRQGIGSKLVIGVRMDPFGAHGWVQLGETVLVGDYEQVRLYTPIVALG